MIRYIYLAGPLSGREQDRNVHRVITAADALIDAGFVPLVPHLSVFWNMISPHPYATWIELDLAWIERCDAVVRLKGESPGADAEVAKAHALGKPVFFGIEDLLATRPTS